MDCYKAMDLYDRLRMVVLQCARQLVDTIRENEDVEIVRVFACVYHWTGCTLPCSCYAWNSGSKYPTSSALNILLYGLQDDVGGSGGAGGASDGAGATGGAGGEVSMEGRIGEGVCCLLLSKSCIAAIIVLD